MSVLLVEKLGTSLVHQWVTPCLQPQKEYSTALIFNPPPQKIPWEAVNPPFNNMWCERLLPQPWRASVSLSRQYWLDGSRTSFGIRWFHVFVCPPHLSCGALSTYQGSAERGREGALKQGGTMRLLSPQRFCTDTVAEKWVGHGEQPTTQGWGRYLPAHFCLLC